MPKGKERLLKSHRLKTDTNPAMQITNTEDPDFVKRGWKFIKSEDLGDGVVKTIWNISNNRVEEIKKDGQLVSLKIDDVEDKVITFWRDTD